MGNVDQVMYYNGTNLEPKFSDRAVRSVARLFSIDEFCLAEDLAILQRRLKERYGVQERIDQDRERNEQDGFVVSVCSSGDESYKDLLDNISLQLKPAPKINEILAYFPLPAILLLVLYNPS